MDGGLLISQALNMKSDCQLIKQLASCPALSAQRCFTKNNSTNLQSVFLSSKETICGIELRSVWTLQRAAPLKPVKDILMRCHVWMEGANMSISSFSSLVGVESTLRINSKLPHGPPPHRNPVLLCPLLVPFVSDLLLIVTANVFLCPENPYSLVHSVLLPSFFLFSHPPLL